MTTNKSNDHDDSGFRVVDKRHFASDGSRRSQEEPSRQPPEAEQPAPPAADFAALVRTLALPALAALGQMGGPDETAGKPDPEVARQFIDLLAVLEEKTRGNLGKEEADLLEQMLFSLRLAVVESSKAGS